MYITSKPVKYVDNYKQFLLNLTNIQFTSALKVVRSWPRYCNDLGWTYLWHDNLLYQNLPCLGDWFLYTLISNISVKTHDFNFTFCKLSMSTYVQLDTYATCFKEREKWHLNTTTPMFAVFRGIFTKNTIFIHYLYMETISALLHKMFISLTVQWVILLRKISRERQL